MVYLAVIVILIVLIIRYDINESSLNRDFWYRFMLVVFILIAGLRWRLGVDTPNYIFYFYHEYPTLDKFSFEDYGIGDSPFYVLINSIVKTYGGRFYIVQLICSSLVNILIFKYIKKHSRYIFTCIFFYFTCYCFTEFNMEIMRGSISIAICLFANDYILEKKWLRGFSLMLLALMFHPQTMLMFVLPFLFFLRLNRTGVAFLIGSFFLGFVLQALLADYLVMLEFVGETASDKANAYIESEFFGEQTYNIKFIAVFFFPWIFYSICSLIYLKKVDKESPVLYLEPLVMIGIMFVLIQFNLQIAYRFVDFFRVYFLICFSELFISLIKHNSLLSKKVSFLRAFILFVPLFFMIGFDNIRRIEEYYPYSSVIDRTINKKRELNYHKREKPRPDANFNEY